MSYSSRKRYKSRREKGILITKNLKRTVLFALIALAILFFQNRVSILNYLNTYFY